jgi:hypothetical protein
MKEYISMKKILISFLAILLLPACVPAPQVQSDGVWNNLNLATGTKCPVTPTTVPCSGIGDTVAQIEVDAKGVPVSVTTIETCASKKVTWKYKDDAANAPAFFIVFNPDISPGGSTYNPISKPKPNSANPTNQELTFNTRAMKGSGASECLNYIIVIPDKGILDPVFIIRK